jgi:hypothetical protein
MSGQSYGGATALRVGHSDPRAKAVLTMDPWWFPNKVEVKEGYFKDISKPVFFVNTERFVTMTNEEVKGVFNKFKEGCSNFEDVIMLDCEHNHQNDIMCLHPFDYELEWFFKSGNIPKSYNHELV